MPTTVTIHNKDNQFWKRLCTAGLVPSWCTRFLIDSGLPGGLVRIIWCGWGDQSVLTEMADAIVREMTSRNADEVRYDPQQVKEEFDSEDSARNFAWLRLTNGWRVQMSAVSGDTGNRWIVWSEK